jgi:hypothetical protein
MAVELNHTIVPAIDPQASAQFLAGILGLSVDPPVAHFTPITLANQVSLDCAGLVARLRRAGHLAPRPVQAPVPG